MPPLEVGKMDKHIVHSDESGNDDDSCDDNHVSLLVMKPFVCSKLHVHKVELLIRYD
jgi:hypothetical protein